MQHQQSNQVIMMLGKSTRGQRVRLNCYVFDTDRFLTDPDSPQSACDMDQLFLLPGKAFILSFQKTNKNKHRNGCNTFWMLTYLNKTFFLWKFNDFVAWDIDGWHINLCLESGIFRGNLDILTGFSLTKQTWKNASLEPML